MPPLTSAIPCNWPTAASPNLIGNTGIAFSAGGSVSWKRLKSPSVAPSLLSPSVISTIEVKRSSFAAFCWPSITRYACSSESYSAVPPSARSDWTSALIDASSASGPGVPPEGGTTWVFVHFTCEAKEISVTSSRSRNRRTPRVSSVPVSRPSAVFREPSRAPSIEPEVSSTYTVLDGRRSSFWYEPSRPSATARVPGNGSSRRRSVGSPAAGAAPAVTGRRSVSSEMRCCTSCFNR